MPKIKQYPVDANGEMVEYEGSYQKVVDWIDIAPFEAKMEFSHHEKGRSSLRFILVDENGKHWSLMAQCIDRFVAQSISGICNSTWVMCKRGANYGLLFADK